MDIKALWLEYRVQIQEDKSPKLIDKNNFTLLLQVTN